MEGKKLNKLLIIIGGIVLGIVLSFGAKTIIDYANKDVRGGVNEERPLGDTCWVSHCASCPTQGSCAVCESGYVMSGGACVQSCPAGTYKSGVNCVFCSRGNYCPPGSTSQNNCSPGYYCPTTSQQILCDAGYYCLTGSTSQSACSVGTYQDETGKASCKVCSSGEFQDETGKTSCETCPPGSYCPTNNIGNVNPTPCQAGTYQDETGKTSCKTCLNPNADKTDCLPSEVSVSCASVRVGSTSNCIVRLNGNIASNSDISFSSSNTSVATVSSSGVVTGIKADENGATITATYTGTGGGSATTTVRVLENTETPLSCPAGQYAKNGNCANCETGYFCPASGANEQICPVGNYCLGGMNMPMTCPPGTTSLPGAGALGDCILPSSIDNCNVSTSITAEHASVSEDNVTTNSYYEVTVFVVGTECEGQTLRYTATNAASLSKQSEIISSHSGAGTYTFRVTPQNACQSSSATATLQNGKSHTSTVQTILHDWTPQSGSWSQESVGDKPKSSADADARGLNEYFTDYNSSDHTYRKRYYRNGCGSPSSPTNPPSSQYACYVSASGDDHKWATTAPDGYTLVPNVGENDCKACYKNAAGDDYKWVATAPNGYTLVPNVNENDCKPPTYACYKNAAGDYQWATTAPDGYTIVTSITQQEDCQVSDSSACYQNSNGTYVWGNYGNNNDYTAVSDILTAENCVAPAACYQNSSGTYVWGQYANDNSYTLVSNITNANNCNNTPVVVPPTAAKVSTIVYVSIAVMAVAGSGFTYYAYRKKKLHLK